MSRFQIQISHKDYEVLDNNLTINKKKTRFLYLFELFILINNIMQILKSSIQIVLARKMKRSDINRFYAVRTRSKIRIGRYFSSLLHTRNILFCRQMTCTIASTNCYSCHREKLRNNCH